MFGKSKNYILNLEQVTNQDFQLVGKQALQLRRLFELGVLIPETFIITSEAFDDFVTSANIVDELVTQLESVTPNDEELAQTASAKISDYILQASFPSIILNPLTHTYKSLSGFSDKYVVVKPSWILDEELLASDYEDYIKFNVKGEASLLYNVKQAWISLFSPESLLLRARQNYSGGLSVAAIVQRMVQAESSGKAYSLDIINHDNGTIEIEAMLGLNHPELTHQIQPDVYKVDKSDMRILEKNIMSQEFMYLRKGRAKPEEDPHFKLDISAEWKRRQKLSDSLISQLAETVKTLSDEMQTDIEVHWALEMGKIYIISVVPYEEIQLRDIRRPELDIETTEEPQLEIMPPEEIVTKVVPPPAQEKAPQVEVTSSPLVEEKAEVQTAEEPVALPQPEIIMSEAPKVPDLNTLVSEVEDIVNGKLVLKVDEPEPTEVEEATTPQEEETDTPHIDTADLAQVDKIIDPELPDNLEEIAEAADLSDIHARFNILSKLYLDISDFSTGKLSSAPKYDGAYLDGTQIVLKHQVLPETLVNDKGRFNKLIESYALDISTAAKVIEPKPLLYSFSDIGDKERSRIMGEAASEEGLDGAERFVEEPAAMLAELMAIKKARNIYDAKNIKLIIPKLRTEPELIDIKKILSSQGLQRSSSMNLFAEVALGAFVYESEHVQSSDVDGLLINLPKLTKSMTARRSLLDRDRRSVLNALAQLQDINYSKGFQYLMLLDPESNLVSELIESKLSMSGIVFTNIPNEEVLQKLSDLTELSQPTFKSRRGRKPKSL